MFCAEPGTKVITKAASPVNDATYKKEQRVSETRAEPRTANTSIGGRR